jgi:hypothetical protein
MNSIPSSSSYHLTCSSSAFELNLVIAPFTNVDRNDTPPFTVWIDIFDEVYFAKMILVIKLACAKVKSEGK